MTPPFSLKQIAAALLVAASLTFAIGRGARADHVASATYTGTHSDGGTVTFEIAGNGGGIVRFAADNFRAGPCIVRSYGVRYAPSPLPIVNHAFDDPDPEMLAPRGRFTASGRASGTFTFIDPEQRSCRTSAPITWQASTAQSAPTPSSTPQRTPTPTPRGTSAPAPSASPGPGSHQFSGDLSVDGDPAVAGFTIIARTDGQECGRARTTMSGRYSIAVAAGSQTRGCGVAGSRIQFSIAPPSGDAWRFDQQYSFQPGGSSRVDLRADLTTLEARPANVPLHNQVWREPNAILIATCNEVSDETLDAAVAAVAMWMDAARDRGLRIGLDVHADACRNDVASIVIDEVDWPDRPRVIGSQLGIGWDGEPCGHNPDRDCEVYTSFVLLNRANRSLSAADRANVLAHEIGHALGLEHAIRCTGGTIMFDDTSCLYPLRLIGVDDIAALNSRYAPVGAVASATLPLVAGDDMIKGERAISRLLDSTPRAEPNGALVDRMRAATDSAPGKGQSLSSVPLDAMWIVWDR